MTWWHGGQRIVGDRLAPPTETGRCRSGDPDAWVYITPRRSLALMYAASCNGWLYEVEPIGPVEQDPGSILPDGASMRCRQATILRRFRPSRVERAVALAAMGLPG